MASGEPTLWQQTLAEYQSEQSAAGSRSGELPPWLAQARLVPAGAGCMEVRLPAAARTDQLTPATRAALGRAM